MSSVATRRCWKESRIVCWSASLREKMTTCRGSPSSPSRSLRASTCPSEPVPPVIRTRLSSSNGVSQSVSRSPGGELRDHLLPGRSRPSGCVCERGAVEAAVDLHLIVGNDLHLDGQCVAQCHEEVVLGDRRGGDVPRAAEIRSTLDRGEDR